MEKRELVGRKILSVKINQEKTVLVLDTDRGPVSLSAEGDCCSYSWFEHIEGIDALVGHTINEVDDVHMGEIDSKEHDCLQSYCLKFRTTGGHVQLEYRNSSNGYYGGYVSIYEGIPNEEFKLLEDDF